jgi:hypothetical protein
MMEWCCRVFEGWYDLAGKRGLGVLVEQEEDGRPRFLLQFRSVDAGDESKVLTEVPFEIKGTVGIAFCPWCGKHLEPWYGPLLDGLPNAKS